MATIGEFTASGNGFSGTIKTLNLNVKATIRAVERTSEKGPDYRILAGATDSAQPGKRPRTKAATTSRSSSMTQASRPRSTQR
ncbi:hypothetical protein RvVAT039_pl11150 (plasmid) [Agrobacterium vitis]|uniref:DUF736 family protein n=1 Tax=Allorhizobium ampelinum (strain ATCC BAA-846 / DSM 112012 / S4) TaxID=311402 RepID=B9K3U9_ALLAM|nr:conserved hypothetical protein [Allorhizobium ampelinum S4]BCH68282.1 hypothetical protein RvVAT039_pl11150 [Agrobacterium vitis]